MSEKHLKKCLVSLVIMEMQIKLTLRFHLTPARMTKTKNPSEACAARMWSKGKTPTLQMGVQTKQPFWT